MQCDTCGNTYARAFRLIDHAGTEHHFDSIECAAQKIAPTCGQCGCRILGHGVETGAEIFCCEHCQRHAGGAGAD